MWQRRASYLAIITVLLISALMNTPAQPMQVSAEVRANGGVPSSNHLVYLPMVVNGSSPQQYLQEQLLEAAQNTLQEHGAPVQLLALQFDGAVLSLDFNAEAQQLALDGELEDVISLLNSAFNSVFEQEYLSEHRSFDYTISFAGQGFNTNLDGAASTAAAPSTSNIHRVALSPGHGTYQQFVEKQGVTPNGWGVERGIHYGIREDDINAELVMAPPRAAGSYRARIATAT